MDEWLKVGAGMVATGWLGTLSYVWHRTVRQIDSKAGKDELGAVLKRVDEHLIDDKVLHRQMDAKMDRLTESVAEVRAGVAELRGTLHGISKNSR